MVRLSCHEENQFRDVWEYNEKRSPCSEKGRRISLEISIIWKISVPQRQRVAMLGLAAHCLQYIEKNRGKFDFFYLIVKCLNGYSNPK